MGAWGERVAGRHLRRDGINVLKRNWRSLRLEADLIARDRSTLVIVEVKTRHHSLKARFPGRLSITEEKRKHLQALLYQFARNNGPLRRRFGISRYRIDSIEVYYSPVVGPLRVATSVEWIRGAPSHQPRD